MPQRPLLILSDAVTSSTGLARIARDLATHIHTHLSSHFRVGVLGVGGSISTSSAYPFYNASIRDLQQMVPMDLPQVWRDFAGIDSAGRPNSGVLLVIWNASWTRWLADPLTLPPGHPVRDFLLQPPPGMPTRDWVALSHHSPEGFRQIAHKPFKRWLYCPVDGHCADGTLGWQMAPVLAGFDRVLAYTEYGARVIERTLKKWGADGLGTQTPKPVGGIIPALPHGLTRAFHSHPRDLGRETLVSLLSNGAKSRPIKPSEFLLAAVGTNTPRKDWGLAFATAEALLRRGKEVLLWGHTDTLHGHWDLPSLVRQHGMEPWVLLTTDRLTDDDLALGFSAADCGLSIGAGEGFGYNGPQMIQCGLPVVHGDYAGGVEFVAATGLVAPAGFGTESPYLIQRPVFDPETWAAAVERVTAGEAERAAAATLPQPLLWEEIWPRWAEWLTEGREGAREGDVK